jgi:NADPH:quinone reductase
MRALVFDRDAPRGLRLGDAPDPAPTAHQALVENRALSLNFGELHYLAERSQPGDVSGWDSAGVVVKAAEDGSGPPAGSRVVTFGWTGAWGALRAVDTDELAVVPESVDLGASAALPVAAVTALRALRKLGGVIGRRVLVTGASGGVGRFAVQLAHRAGAHVIGSVGSPSRGEGLTELGADEVVIGLDGVEAPLHGVLDNVAGPQMAEAFALIRGGGSLQWIGIAAPEPAPFDIASKNSEARLEPFFVGPRMGEDLAYLVSLLERRQLDAQIGWRGSWDRAAEATDALFARRVNGKAVLDVG